GSIDLTLSNEFRIFKKKSKISVTEFSTYKDYTEPVKKNEIKLKPGEFINGITVENIKLPPNICGILTGRSKFARMGVLVHATASFIQPGINNRQVLEIKNISKNTLILKPGIRICQLVLMETKVKAEYSGR
ncbi:MAG: dCTP deaminase, partial [Thermodesulfobacteriota bacterium]